MQHNDAYMNVFNDIRSKIHMLNTQLSTYKEPETQTFDTKGVHHTDMTMLKHSQNKNNSLEFIASLNTFSFHWETMTIQQQKKYINDYVESEYSSCSNEQKDAIQLFLEKEIINKKHGHKMVKWNGYFIEHLPEIQIQQQKTSMKDCEQQTEHATTTFSIKFKPKENNEHDAQRNKKDKHASFSVIRAKLQREKEMFYAK